MTDDSTLYELTKQLDAEQATYAMLDLYYSGRQPLAYMSEESKSALGDRLSRMCSNIPRIAVGSLAERMRLTGFEGVDVWGHFLRNDFDQRSGLVHRDALTLGQSYVIVWADKQSNPLISAESAKQVAVTTDPATGQVTAALKRWVTDKTTEAVLYLPGEIRRYSAPTVGATSGGFDLVGDPIDNPLGKVPVVPFRNTDRLLDDGVSEIADLAPLVDALNKELADMMVGSEYAARPRRFATGIEITTDDDGNEVNPIPEGNRSMVSEDPESKFGQLDAADLSGYQTAVKVLQEQIMAVSGLPAHYVGILSNQPASADALRASEAALTARAEAKQLAFGRSWEAVANLVSKAAGGPGEGAVVQWSDPATRSVAQEADAVVKLFQSGLLPASYALKKLGYSQPEIDAIRTARRLEAIDASPILGSVTRG